MSIELADQIARTEQVRQWLRKSGRNLTANRSAKIVAVAASMQLVFEHHGAILLLAKNGMHASLLALLRPLYEAYVWATWLFRIASKEQLIQLAHGRLKRSMERMIGDLDRQKFFEEPMLVDMKPLISRMDGFVHGGFEHLRYRIHQDDVVARYPDELIVDAMRFADLFAVMTMLEWPAMTEDAELGDHLYSEALELLNLTGRR